MKKTIEQVYRWQSFFGRKNHIVVNSPRLLDEKTAQARVDFIIEELNEYLVANKGKDIVGVFDAILDILYFTFGMIVVHGLHELAPRGFDIVHNCNMSKLWPGDKVRVKKDGKVLKPDDFKKPEEELKHLLGMSR